MFLRPKLYIEITSIVTEFITLITTFVLLCSHDAIDEWYRLLIQIQFVMFKKFYDKKIVIEWYLIIRVYIIHEWCFLGFPDYWKFAPNSHASVIRKRARQCCQKKCDVRENSFYGFISINNTSRPFFNRIIAARIDSGTGWRNNLEAFYVPFPELILHRIDERIFFWNWFVSLTWQKDVYCGLFRLFKEFCTLM